MQHGSDASPVEAATLNTVAAAGFGNGRRRIDRLRQLAYDCQLTDNDARQFGKLTATATWELLLSSHGLEFEPKIENTPNTAATASIESPHQLNLIDWIDWAQALALALASVGLAVMILGLFPRINPLQLPQVRVTIEFGDKK